MPDPRSLKVGDRVRFVSLPEEWSHPEFHVPREDLIFMNSMIQRTWPSRVSEIDEFGYPWIRARMRTRGKVHHHRWMISEATGWRRVEHRP